MACRLFSAYSSTEDINWDSDVYRCNRNLFSWIGGGRKGFYLVSLIDYLTVGHHTAFRVDQQHFGDFNHDKSHLFFC